MKNPLKITTRNQFVFWHRHFSNFSDFWSILVSKSGVHFSVDFAAFLASGVNHLIWAPMAPQGVPKSPPGSNLGDILVDFNDFHVHFWGRILFPVVIVREFRCEKTRVKFVTFFEQPLQKQFDRQPLQHSSRPVRPKIKSGFRLIFFAHLRL